MKYTRKAAVLALMTLAVGGLANAGTIVQSFSLPPSGSQSTTWTLSNGTGIQSYDYLQSLNPTVLGTLSSVNITMSWSSTGFGTGLDINTGSTGGATDAYTFESDTIVSLTADGNVINLNENTSSSQTNPPGGPTGCVDSGFSHVAFNQTFVENACIDNSTLEASKGDGSVLSQTFASPTAGYVWFEGAATVNNLSFTGHAVGSDSITGGPVTSTLMESAQETVTVTYNYNAPAGVPEPATLFLMGSALVGCGLLRKRLKSDKQ